MLQTTRAFDKKEAEKIVNQLLKQYKITVKKWRTTSSGCANWKKKYVEIPKPTNLDKFLVCMHEVKHVIDGDLKTRYEEEFACDMYARDWAIKLGYSTIEWDQRTRWHTLAALAMAMNRGSSVDKIPKKIKDFFPGMNWVQWHGKSVFASRATGEPGYTLKFTKKMSTIEVNAALRQKNLWMYKSNWDDSTNGKWIVAPLNSRFGNEFYNLPGVITHYAL